MITAPSTDANHQGPAQRTEGNQGNDFISGDEVIAEDHG
jgi:hypothetical protein